MNAILNYLVWGRRKNGVFIRAGFCALEFNREVHCLTYHHSSGIFSNTILSSL